MRISSDKVNPSLKKEIVNAFIQVLTDLDNRKDIETFIKDFFNEAELETYSKRLAIAYWLKKKRSYTNIKNNLKVSSATIATVEKLIDNPGFRLAIKDLEADEWANVWSEKIKKLVK